MTNKQLIKNWKNLGIIPDTDPNEVYPMKEMFLICWGELEVDPDETPSVKMVIFDTGGPQGSPAMWCHSNENNEIIQLYWDDKSESHISKKTGKFVKLPKEKNENKKRVRK